MRYAFYTPHWHEEHLPTLQKLSQSQNIRQRGLSLDIFDVPATPPAELLAFCERERIEFAKLPKQLQMQDFSLIVSDMDSTLITIECIDEIADFAGIKPKIAEITERAMRGELDFAQSLTERVALLRGLPADILEKVYAERLQLMTGAESLIAACQAHDLKFVLVSGGFTYFTDRLKQRLGLYFTAANALEIDKGCLTGRVVGQILDADAKAFWLENKRAELQLQPAQTIAIGDGANDLKMIEKAGLGVAFHAKPVVRERADCAIRFYGLEVLPALLG